MRSYSQIVPTFWMRGSGKKLRGNPVAQVLALYFMTAPQSNLIGLYYISINSIVAETGLTEEQIHETLPLITDIVSYDLANEIAYLPMHAAYQIGDYMHGNDKRKQLVLKDLELVGSHPFVDEFLNKYGDSYHLKIQTSQTSQQNYTQLKLKGHPGAEMPPVIVTVTDIAKDLNTNNIDLRSDLKKDLISIDLTRTPVCDEKVSESLPQTPVKTSEVSEQSADSGQKQLTQKEIVRKIFDFWREKMNCPRAKLDFARETKIKARLKDFSPKDLCRAIIGATKDNWIMGRDPGTHGKKYNDFKTIFRDNAQVERFIELSGAKTDAKGAVFIQDEDEALKNKEEIDKKKEEVFRSRLEEAKMKIKKYNER